MTWCDCGALDCKRCYPYPAAAEDDDGAYVDDYDDDYYFDLRELEHSDFS